MRALPLSLLLATAMLAGQAAPVTPAGKAFAAAKQLFDMRLDQQAIGSLQEFINKYATDPNVPHAQLMLGRCYRRQQQYDKAVQMLGTLVSTATTPEYALVRAEAHFEMAESFVAMKDYERAIRSYGFCLKLANDPDLVARAQYWKAESLYQLNRDDEALDEYRRVTEIAPSHKLASWAFYSIGMIELRKERFAAAIPPLERVLTQYKDSELAGESQLALGFAYAGRARAAAEGPGQENDYRKAIETFTAVLESTGATPRAKEQATLALAYAYSHLKQYDKSYATYAKALEQLDASSQQAAKVRLQMAHALYNAGKYEEAGVEYARVAGSKFATLAPEALYWLGNSWYQQATQSKTPQAFTQAAAAFDRFLTDPGDQPALAPRAALFQAFCYEDLAGLGENAAAAKAIAAFKVIVDKWPASREANEAQAGIARLTVRMSPEQLRGVAGSLPEGAASWNVALRLAREEFLAGKYNGALAAATTVLEGSPTGELAAQANYLAGAGQQKLGKPDLAIAHYKKVLAANVSSELNVFAQRGLTQAYLDTQRFAEARATAQALLKLPMGEKEQAEALMYLAEAFAGAKQPAEAAATYQKVVKEYPGSPLVPNALMGVAWMNEVRKDREQAIVAYRQLIVDYPDDRELVPQAFFRLGVNLAEMKDYAAAIEAFKNVPAGHKWADQAAYGIAWAYKDQGKVDEANAQFALLSEHYPDSTLAADSLYRVGEAKLEAKEYAEAARMFNRALEMVGANNSLAPLIAYKLAVCSFYADQYTVAADAFGKVVVNYPTSEYAADSLFWRAQAQEKLGQFGPARESFLQYIARHATQPLVLDAALGAGRAAYQATQYATARNDLQNALARCGEFAQSANSTLAERAKNVAPEAQFYLAESFFREKKYDEAIKEFAAVSVYAYEPWYSRSLLHMAECSALTGDRDAATRTLLLLQREFPNSDAAKEAPAVANKYNLSLTDR
jgi:TolA-binding protein